MLGINKTQDGSELNVALSGRLDTETATDFDEQVVKELDGITSLTVDLADVMYVSSAGFRVLMLAAKELGPDGAVSVTNANETVREAFDMTGLTEVLNVK